MKASNKERLAAVRDIVTAWNFGPGDDRWAMHAIFKIVGDNIQGDPQGKSRIRTARKQPTPSETNVNESATNGA